MKTAKCIMLSIFCFIISCNEKLIEKPKDLIAQDKMVQILYDLAILNAALNANAAVLDEHNIKTMQYIYAKHDIDSIQFAQSDLYYASIPTTYEKMYAEIVTRLENEHKDLEELRSKGPDSIEYMKKAAKKAEAKQ